MTNQTRERGQILEMLKDGVISVDEATRLLDALGDVSGSGHSQHEMVSTRVPAKARFLHILVRENGGEKTHLRIPIMLLKLGSKLIPKSVEKQLQVGSRQIDIEELVGMIDQGVMGDLMTVQEEDKTVRIYVE